MSTSVRHVLGISGGKDSAALAVYMKNKYPQLDIEFYSCDTGKELDETYKLIKDLEAHGIRIRFLRAAENSSESPFDHFLKMYGGYLPSSNARWCTKKLKLEPFEKYVGSDSVISYVGIRGDESRDGYISTKKNIQTIFPFRKNIWSEDVVVHMLANRNLETLNPLVSTVDFEGNNKKVKAILNQEISPSFTFEQKFNALLGTSVKGFNHLVFEYLKTTEYPLGKETSFPLLENDEILVKADIFRLLKENAVEVPSYYNKIDFEIDGKRGQYSRSRSGCYFCFFQQKIEWVWLFEQHPDLFEKAMRYEKEGYTWGQSESLEELIKPERIRTIKEEYIKRSEKQSHSKSRYLIDILEEDDDVLGCAACFI